MGWVGLRAGDSQPNPSSDKVINPSHLLNPPLQKLQCHPHLFSKTLSFSPKMAAISSLFSQTLLHHPTKTLTLHSKPSIQPLKPFHFLNSVTFKAIKPKRPIAVSAVTAEAPVATSDVAARRLYVGNIPRTLDSAELARIVEEHGAVEKAEVFRQFIVDFIWFDWFWWIATCIIGSIFLKFCRNFVNVCWE